jgi:hypothetical protein
MEWGETRRIGRTPYIWKRWVLGWGGLFALSMSLGLVLKGATWAEFLFIWGASLLGGYFLGVWYWRSAEQEHASAEQRGRTKP